MPNRTRGSGSQTHRPLRGLAAGVLPAAPGGEREPLLAAAEARAAAIGRGGAGREWSPRLTPDDLDRLVSERTAALARTVGELTDARSAMLNMMTDLVEGKERLERTNADLEREIAARQQAQVQEARLAAAVEQAAEAVFITDTEARITYVNPAFTVLTGYGPERALGRHVRFPKNAAQDEEFWHRLTETIMRGDVWHGRIANRRPDGTTYEVDATISPVRDQGGTIVNYISVSRDVTRELDLESQLRQAQKLHAIGRLAGGIAHDFNNLLTAIIGNAELLVERLIDSEASEMLEEVRHAAARAAALTRQLLAFSRRQVLTPQLVDVNEAVANLTKLLGRLLGEDVRLVVRAAEGKVTVRADPGQLDQVLVNLAVNARDAMPAGGTLTITTGPWRVDAAAAMPERAAGDYVSIAMADTGCGMSEEIKAHLFEPFFTTKPEGKGTGLGLATVFGIVTQAGGWIDVESEPGRGTTFRVVLPRVTAESAVETAAKDGPISRGAERILVVEDESPVRQFTVKTLRSLGYAVLEADSGVAALTLMRRTDRIDLLLTDAIMPGMSGGELMARALAETRELKVLCMSGYVDPELIPGDIGGVPVPFLQKPFTPRMLAAKIRAVLDADSGRRRGGSEQAISARPSAGN